MRNSNKILNTTVSGDELLPICCVLPSQMTIETAEALGAEFKQLPLAEHSSLQLDASQVEQLTTPGLQLLLSLKQTMAARGGRMTIEKKTQAFIRACRDAGLLEFT